MKTLRRNMENEIRYFSMFTGVGGFELGLRGEDNRGFLQKKACKNLHEGESDLERGSSRFTCVGMSEFNKYPSQVLRYKFPNVKNWGDCTKIKPEDSHQQNANDSKVSQTDGQNMELMIKE